MTAPAGLVVPFVPGDTEATTVGTPILPPAAGDPAPTITAEFGFDANADDANPVWFNLTELAADGVAPMLSGNTRRGRSSERDDITAGSANLLIDNPNGDITPNTAAGPLAGKVKVDKQARIKVTPPAPYDLDAAYIFRGFVTDWDGDIKGAFETAQTSATLTDNSDGLALVGMRSDFATELLALGPWGYWPGGEPDGAIAVGDMSGAGRPALPLKSFVGTTDIVGVYKFGADPLTPSDSGTSLTLTPIVVGGATDSGYYLEAPTAGAKGVQLKYSDGFALVCAFRTVGAPSTAMTLIEVDDATGNNLVQAFLGGTLGGSPFSGRLEVFFFPGAGGTGNFWNSAEAFNDGKPHLLVLVIRSDGKNMDVYVDGVLRTTITLATSGAGTVVDGRITFGIGTGQTTSGFPWLGDIGKLAIFTKELTGAQVARLWQGWLGFPSEDADDRNRRYLGYATWPAGTIFDDAATTLDVQKVDQFTADNGGVLAAIKQATASEQGLFFIGPDGTARFHARKHRVNAASRVTFDQYLPVDRSSLGPFTENRQTIANDVTGTRTNGSTQRVIDQPSIDAHRRRTQNLDLAVTSDEELYSAISWYLLRYKESAVRVGSVVLDPYTTPALWPWALGLEIGDRITLDDLPPTAPAPMMDFYVESIGHDFSRAHFKTTLQLSPADTWGPFWRLGVPGYSTLGVSTRLSY